MADGKRIHQALLRAPKLVSLRTLKTIRLALYFFFLHWLPQIVLTLYLSNRKKNLESQFAANGYGMVALMTCPEKERYRVHAVK